jgi:Putative metallopeptidase
MGARSVVCAALALTVLALGVAGCGGGGSSSPTGASGASGATGAQGRAGSPVVVYFAPAAGGRANQIGRTLLKAGRISLIGNTLASTFELPETVKIHGVNGFGGGPFFNPKNNTITFQYGFANLVFETLAQLHPEWSRYRLGQAVGAVNAFILEHEFAHALVSIYNLPVLGREEDAADDLATLLLLQVPGQGDQFVADSAEFWAALSGRQRTPTLSDYADVHSLDLQRALEMLCELAGSSKRGFREVARLNVLPASRLNGCPAEFKEKAKSFEQVLDPHLDHPLDLG